MKNILKKIYIKINNKKKQYDLKLKRYNLEKNSNIILAKGVQIFEETNLLTGKRGKIIVGENSFIHGELQCIRNKGVIKIGS